MNCEAEMGNAEILNPITLNPTRKTIVSKSMNVDLIFFLLYRQS